jgi:hypothetical protein
MFYHSLRKRQAAEVISSITFLKLPKRVTKIDTRLSSNQRNFISTLLCNHIESLLYVLCSGKQIVATLSHLHALNGGNIMQNFGKRYKKFGVTYLRHYFRIFPEEFEMKKKSLSDVRVESLP